MDYLTVAQAAAELELSGRAIRARISMGQMRAERVNSRLWLIARDEVERWRSLGKLKPDRVPKPKEA